MTNLQQEAEQLYPYPESAEPWWLAIIDEKRAAHIACAEKYTAIIGEKDKEIARLRILIEIAWRDGFEFDIRRIDDLEREQLWNDFANKNNLKTTP